MSEYKADTQIGPASQYPEMPVPYGWLGNADKDTWRFYEGTYKEVMYRIRTVGCFDDEFLRKINVLHKKKEIIQQIESAGMKLKYNADKRAWYRAKKTQKQLILEYLADKQIATFSELRNEGFQSRSIASLVYEGKITRKKGVYTI